MARPPKKESEKRQKRHTLYLTVLEDSLLRETAEELQQDITKCLYEALHDWLRKYGKLK